MNPVVFKETTKVALGGGDIAGAALLTALGLGAAAAITGGLGYAGYRYGKNRGNKDVEEGTVGLRTPGIGTYALGSWPAYAGGRYGYREAAGTSI